MADRTVSSLAVVDDGGKAIGIVTQGDLARRVYIPKKSRDNIIVEEIMQL
jgi:CBS domain-containing protein